MMFNTGGSIRVLGLGAFLAVGLLAMPEVAAGQWEDDDHYYDEEDYGPPRGAINLFGTAAFPVGEFGRFVDAGGGVGGGGMVYLNDSRTAAFRLDGSFIVYGTESFRAPLSPTIPFVDVDVRTTNYIASVGVGPQIFLGEGPVRPYLFGTVGFAYFATRTSVSGTHEIDDFASTTNFDDITLALNGGGGLSVELTHGDNPTALDLGVIYHKHGLTEYLTEGDLFELPGGGWGVDPILSETNLVTFRVGVSIGVR